MYEVLHNAMYKRFIQNNVIFDEQLNAIKNILNTSVTLCAHLTITFFAPTFKLCKASFAVLASSIVV